MRDVSRSSRSVARVAMDACRVRRGYPARRNAAAYGEVVWFWRRDPGVYPACLCGLGNGGKKGRSPGRARISRQTSRGEGRDVSAVPVVFCPCASARGMPVCSWRTGSTGAVDARPSLRPLFKRGPTNWHHPGENASRERKRVFPRHRRASARNQQRIRPRSGRSACPALTPQGGWRAFAANRTNRSTP